MSSDQWYILGAFLLGMGVCVLVISQVVLGRWLKRFMQE